jgi:putative PIN family toxin of toxin-antitoxin system
MGSRGPVVIDTNVWISGVLTRSGIPAQLVRQVVRQGHPVFSPDTFAELKQRLWLPKFDRYVSMDDRRRLLQEIDTVAIWIDIPPQIAEQTFCRDADDDKFIQTALAAGASRLITGDDDLLCLDPLGELRILTPRAALDELQSGV